MPTAWRSKGRLVLLRRAFRGEEDLSHGPAVRMRRLGNMRPDIVGSAICLCNGPDRGALMTADLFVSIGTSGAVYPRPSTLDAAIVGAHARDEPRSSHGIMFLTKPVGREVSWSRRGQMFLRS